MFIIDFFVLIPYKYNFYIYCYQLKIKIIEKEENLVFNTYNYIY
jgi:hypothetical protein